MAINRDWHLKNKMPKNPSIEEKVLWHSEHTKNCSCRPGFPKGLLEIMKKKGISKESVKKIK